MSELLDTMLRFERGELPPHEAAEVRRRLENDAQARDWLEWIAVLRRASASEVWERASADPPDPMEIAALAEGTLPAGRARDVRAALARSAEGYGMFEAALEEVHAATPLDAPGSGDQHPRPARLLRDPRAWIAAAAVLLAIFAVGRFAPDPGVDVTALARREPLLVATLRSGEDPIQPGLRAYGNTDYAAAVGELSAATVIDPENCLGWLYLGSALLLLERAEEAVPALEHAADSCTGSLADEARWQLAQARLAGGDGPRAAALLESLTESNHADDARTQLEGLGSP